MKNIVILAIVSVFLGSTANAGKLFFATKFGIENESYNEASGTPSETAFRAHMARLIYAGKKGDFKYFLRYGLNQVPSTTRAATDNLSGSTYPEGTVDLLWVKQQINDNFALTLGRQETRHLAYDNEYTTKTYMSSIARKDAGTTHWYGSGATVTGTFGAHNLNLSYFNQTDESTSQQSRGMAGFYYNGSFMDGVLGVRANYYKDTLQNSSPSKNDKAYTDLMAVGVEFKPMPWYVSLSHIQNKRVNQSNIAYFGSVVDDKEIIVTSLVLKAGFWFSDHFVGHFKYDLGKQDNKDTSAGGATIKTDYNGMEATAEYHPMGPKGMINYHASFFQEESKTDQDGAEKKVETTVMAGISFAANVLE